MNSTIMLGVMISNFVAWGSALTFVFWLSRIHERERRRDAAKTEARMLELVQISLASYRAQSASEAVAIVDAVKTPIPEPTNAEAAGIVPSVDRAAGDVVGFAMSGGLEVDFLTPPGDLIGDGDEERLLRRE